MALIKTFLDSPHPHIQKIINLFHQVIHFSLLQKIVWVGLGVAYTFAAVLSQAPRRSGIFMKLLSSCCLLTSFTDSSFLFWQHLLVAGICLTLTQQWILKKLLNCLIDLVISPPYSLLQMTHLFIQHVSTEANQPSSVSCSPICFLGSPRYPLKTVSEKKLCRGQWFIIIYLCCMEWSGWTRLGYVISKF